MRRTRRALTIFPIQGLPRHPIALVYVDTGIAHSSIGAMGIAVYWARSPGCLDDALSRFVQIRWPVNARLAPEAQTSTVEKRYYARTLTVHGVPGLLIITVSTLMYDKQ